MFPSLYINKISQSLGMSIYVKAKHNLDMTMSWVIGDKRDYIKAVNKAGIKNTILVKSIHF